MLCIFSHVLQGVKQFPTDVVKMGKLLFESNVFKCVFNSHCLKQCLDKI